MTKLMLLGLVLGAMALGAKAQQWTVDYSIHAGVNSSEYMLDHVKSGISRESSHAYNGFLSGLVTFSPFKYGGLQTGLSLNGLGAKLEKSEF
ncbi:hypothetical protein [Parapedobacter tibetensis]|uniref:hypothetical protein n=1 Tax=Parapedobacter tibetensis TaxID=2972951 RepID=UPI00214DA866|nr:hypothetical protein [Parapedobacter tibetensis]